MRSSSPTLHPQSFPYFFCALPVPRVYAFTQPSLVMGSSPGRTAHFLQVHPAPPPSQPGLPYGPVLPPYGPGTPLASALSLCFLKGL